MARDDYQKSLERHLADYKEQRLGVREKSTFVHRGVEQQYRHILPMSLQWLNIPEPFRKEVHEYVAGHRQANARLVAQLLDGVLTQVKRPLRSQVSVAHDETVLEQLRKDAASGLAWYAWWLQQKYVPV